MAHIYVYTTVPGSYAIHVCVYSSLLVSMQDGT
jgi:hypothetical protein